jgi:hypothetical protein
MINNTELNSPHNQHNQRGTMFGFNTTANMANDLNSSSPRIFATNDYDNQGMPVLSNRRMK